MMRFLGLFLFVAVGAGCSSESMVGIGGYCEVNEDCLSISQHLEGTYCVGGRCTCPAGEELCCPGGKEENCIPGVRNDYKCRPETECHPPDMSDAGTGGAASGTGSSTGAGGAGTGGAGVGGAGGGGGGPQWECIADADCPGPSEPRCGAGKCVEGKCDLDVKVGPLASQIYGDCKRVECDWFGNKIEFDDSGDVYNDGNACTLDYCENGEQKNNPFPDGFPCPDVGAGYCYEGSCVECIGGLPYALCGSGLTCDAGFYCVPFPSCTMLGCGGLCAPCEVGFGCASDADCMSGNCNAGMCQLPTCNDGKKDDGETGVDCGSNDCGPCPDGEGCKVPVNCQSGVCMFGKCQAPTCTDGILNGQESGIDCGGICDPCL